MPVLKGRKPWRGWGGGNELSLGSTQHGAEFRHSPLHCNPERGLSCPTTGQGLRATLNCCANREDTGQVSRKEARGMKQIMAGQLHLEPTKPEQS